MVIKTTVKDIFHAENSSKSTFMYNELVCVHLHHWKKLHHKKNKSSRRNFMFTKQSCGHHHHMHEYHQICHIRDFYICILLVLTDKNLWFDPCGSHKWKNVGIESWPTEVKPPIMLKKIIDSNPGHTIKKIFGIWTMVVFC